MRIFLRPVTLLLIILTVLLVVIAKPAFAQNVNPFNEPVNNPDVPQNLHTFSQNVFIEVLSAASCQLAGLDPVDPQRGCLGVDPKTKKIGYIKDGGGAIGFMTKMIAVLYVPPVSSGDYFRYMAQNFGLVKPAYAQGVGLPGIKPLLNLWVAFRNMVYFLFVIVFILIGLAIMLRIKIDPRTVMSIENSLPKVIIGLLLVTFSFAIAGFLIDLMYVFTYLAINTLSNAAPSINPATINKELYTPPIGFANEVMVKPGGFAGGILNMAWDAAGSVRDIIGGLLNYQTDIWKWIKQPSGGFGWGDFLTFSIPIIGPILGLASQALDLSTLLGNILGFVVTWIFGILGFLVITVALLWALFRLWFELIKAYVFLLLDIVFAPFFIIAGVIPGSPLSFSSWIREVLSNLSPFPVAIIMFLLGKAFMEGFTAQGKDMFVPPLIGNPNALTAFGSLIGLGIVLITPQVVTMMKDYLKAPQFKYATAIGQALTVGANVPVGTGKNLTAITLAQKGGGWGGVAKYLATGQMPINMPTQPQTGGKPTP